MIMLETMYDSKGVGLAATQVDIHLRIVVMDFSDENSEPLVLINPGFKPMTDELTDVSEGCLSVYQGSSNCWIVRHRFD